jgi:hypothetical protein
MATNEEDCKKLIGAYEAVQGELDRLTSGEVYFETDRVIELRQEAEELAEQIRDDCPEYLRPSSPAE